MPEPSSSNGEKDDEPALDRFRKRLTPSGSGGGVSLHFNADFASRYGLDAETDVVVEVVEEDGDVRLEIGDIPAGFDHEDLEAFAEEQRWSCTDKFVGDDEWYLTYRNEHDNVRVQIDSEAQIGGNRINNVVVESDPVEVTDSLERYDALCAAAGRKGLRVRVNDSEGLWQRLRSSGDHDTDDAPDRETFEQLTKIADSVTTQLVCERPSVNTSLQDLRQIVAEIEAAYEEFETKEA